MGRGIEEAALRSPRAQVWDRQCNGQGSGPIEQDSLLEGLARARSCGLSLRRQGIRPTSWLLGRITASHSGSIVDDRLGVRDASELFGD